MVRYLIECGPALGSTLVLLSAIGFGWFVTGVLLVFVTICERFVMGLTWSVTWPFRLLRRR
jgi:hypothetical protein